MANVQRACLLAGLSRRVAYAWKRADQAFAQAWNEALDRGADALEDEAVRRAHEGVLKPVFQNGAKVGEERVYSDRLLEVLLKAHRPWKYRENVKVEHEVGVNLAQRLEYARVRVQALGHGAIEIPVAALASADAEPSEPEAQP
jgi:hypothetical protein